MLRKALREATYIFFMSRLVILVATLLALRFPLAGEVFPRSCSDSQCFLLSLWDHWDVTVYMGLAAHGYGSVHEAVFFPLWPLVVHMVGVILGGSTISYYIAGLLLANLFFYLALVVFYALLLLEKENFVDEDTARRALFYLALSPYAIFFFVGYTESLFLLLSLLVFLSLQQKRFWIAGVSGFLVALTRSQGILLVLPFLVEGCRSLWPVKVAWREKLQIAFSWPVKVAWREKLQIVLSMICVPLGILVYMTYSWSTWGDPFAFSSQEGSYWHRSLTFPLQAIFAAFQAMFHAPTLDLFLLNLGDIVFVLLFLAVLIVGWKRLPLHYSLFALALILFSISYPQGVVEPLTAAPRYMLVVFPAFLVVGMREKHSSWATVLSAILFAMNTMLFVAHHWLA
jgi:Gpi18-like mannosyltransferase